MLRVSGTSIVDPTGDDVVLKGAGLGGMLNMENFITGYSGHEHEHRAALTEVLGKEMAEFYFSRLLHHFFSEPRRHKRVGVPAPGQNRQHCSKYNIYVVLDLHAVPGGQNQDWHSDSGLSRAPFWEFRDFQDRETQLWTAIARHYAGNPVVAGYNPLNEPADAQHTRLISWYERVEAAIRPVDPDHMLFLDGNTYAMDFSAFDATKTLPNAVYSCHDYSMMGLPLPEQYEGTAAQKKKLRVSFERKVKFMREAGVPIWNGEFGPVYQDPRTDSDAAETNQTPSALPCCENSWLYTGRAAACRGAYGCTRTSATRAWCASIPRVRTCGSCARLSRRSSGWVWTFWACADKTQVNALVYQPLISKLKDMVPEHLRQKQYPKIWTFDKQVERVVRECLMSEYLGWELAEAFEGETEEELEELAGSFALEECLRRDELNWILQMDTRVPLTKGKKGASVEFG